MGKSSEGDSSRQSDPIRPAERLPPRSRPEGHSIDRGHSCTSRITFRPKIPGEGSEDDFHHVVAYYMSWSSWSCPSLPGAASADHSACFAFRLQCQRDQCSLIPGSRFGRIAEVKIQLASRLPLQTNVKMETLFGPFFRSRGENLSVLSRISPESCGEGVENDRLDAI